ncbi:phage tail protein [Nocardia panacis]|uniref:Gp37-like protein n=1 Tax=Nocardia panacis TaxID=2340916 RepID=UPI001EF048EF|nr:phage tail protein [Nocardia panacis]
MKTTAMAQIRRLEQSLWMLPDNPLDFRQWGDFAGQNWTMIVKPDLTPDESVTAVVHSRFKTLHDATKNVMKDAQLTWEVRRYLDGDEPPWPGAKLRHGCLVIDAVDHSGARTGTAFGGDVFTGLRHEKIITTPDGKWDAVDKAPDPNMPTEYYRPGWQGTLAAVPGIIYHENEYGAVQTSEYSWKPASDVQVVAGGSSMPGVNEGISAAIKLAGSLLALIPGVPDLGNVADTILHPIYSNVFMAFGAWKDADRIARLGQFHLKERFGPNGDKAYTIAWLLAMRTALWETRETTRLKVTIEDGAGGWRVGQNGHGHYYIGSRIGVAALGLPPGQINIERVSELTLEWSRDQAPKWHIVLGEREPEDPVVKAWEQFQEILGILRDLGVLG